MGSLFILSCINLKKACWKFCQNLNTHTALTFPDKPLIFFVCPLSSEESHFENFSCRRRQFTAFKNKKGKRKKGKGNQKDVVHLSDPNFIFINFSFTELFCCTRMNDMSSKVHLCSHLNLPIPLSVWRLCWLKKKIKILLPKLLLVLEDSGSATDLTAVRHSCTFRVRTEVETKFSSCCQNNSCCTIESNSQTDTQTNF